MAFPSGLNPNFLLSCFYSRRHVRWKEDRTVGQFNLAKSLVELQDSRQALAQQARSISKLLKF
jgi:hypothetical protein